MQRILLDSPALLCIALRIILTASLLRYRCKIFVLNFTLLHLQALELEQSLPSLPSHGLQRPVSRTMLHYLS